MKRDLSPMDERSSERSNVSIAVVIFREHRDPTPAHMLDIGALGCRLQTSEALRVGNFLTITVENMPQMQGWVAWTKGPTAGIAFAHCPPKPLIERLRAM